MLARGAKPADAAVVLILLHGRGASAEDILGLAQELRIPNASFVAPQAANSTWYPYSFLAPLDRNEPYLSSALNRVGALLEDLTRQGVGAERVAIMGFSQGACLSLEFAARHAGRYGGVFALSGGLIGPPGTPRDYPGTFDATPVFLGCSDVDPHIPIERVHESADVFRRMGASVDERIYPRMGHTVNRDEIDAVRAVLLAGPL